MGKIKKILIGLAVFFFILIVVVVGFWFTGGKSLVLAYKNYLSQDIPDKQYSWTDFTDRGPREMMHGYYAGADSSAFYMWTLSGLKRFAHKQDMSVYYYVDPCGLIKQLEDGSKPKAVDGQNNLEEKLSFDFEVWKTSMRTGDYVWVKRVGEGVDKKVIDKVWGSSNNTHPLNTITEQSCE